MRGERERGREGGREGERKRERERESIMEYMYIHVNSICLSKYMRACMYACIRS